MGNAGDSGAGRDRCRRCHSCEPGAIASLSPLWIAEPGCEAINDVDGSRAVAAGLACRPVTDTIRDTLAWDAARGGAAPDDEGLPAAEEARLLRDLDR